VPDSSGRVEGFGLVYLEAAAGGLPSVATAIGGVADAVLADETGLLVQPSIEDIARAIATLAEDTDTRSVLAAGASAHARALSWQRCAAETYRLSRPSRPSVENTSDDPSAATQPQQPHSAPHVSAA
jgi:phosphatidylinositol alpha-1,6-mannosyltransferase